MKKRIIITGIVLVVILAVGMIWTAYETYRVDKQNEKYGIQVSAENVTPTSASFVLECSGLESKEPLCVDDSMSVIEKRTLFGWREIKHLRGGSFFVASVKKCSIQYGVIKHRIDVEWEYYYGELSKGTYRMKKPIYKDIPIGSNEFVDYCYLTFNVK